MEKHRNIPALRFHEFGGEWERKKLGEISSWESGGTPSKNDASCWNGDIPWISASSMHGVEYCDSELKITTQGLKNGSRLAKKGSILILVRGSMLFNKIPIGITTKDVAFNQDLKSITIDGNSNAKYILHWFKYLEPQILSMVTSTGIGAGKLDLADLKNLHISLPALPEQQKITNFLTAIDQKLQTLKKKKALLEQYKKGVMQKIFSQELRFKDENGNDFVDWEVKRLGDVLNYEQPTNYLVKSTDYNNSYTTPVLTAGKTFLLGYTNETSGIFKDNLPVIIFDDFTTATQFVDFPFKAKSSAMKILKAKDGSNIKFVYELMQNINYEIGGHGRHWISVFSQMELSLPSIEEQSTIANFLTAIDQKITQLQTQIEKTDHYKKGLLQKLFC